MVRSDRPNLAAISALVACGLLSTALATRSAVEMRLLGVLVGVDRFCAACGDFRAFSLVTGSPAVGFWPTADVTLSSAAPTPTPARSAAPRSAGAGDRCPPLLLAGRPERVSTSTEIKKAVGAAAATSLAVMVGSADATLAASVATTPTTTASHADLRGSRPA